MCIHKYFRDRMNTLDERKQLTMHRNIKGSEILKSELKVAGPNRIIVEMLTGLDDFGIDKITDIINGI